MQEYTEEFSFARRFRTVNLEGYVGNIEVKETVKNYMRTSRPQSYLMYGHSGCGKTTIARVIAREYNCENRDPEHGACGVCPSCLAYDEYIRSGNTDELPDLYEIDASDSSGKKDIDAILSTLEYPPMGGAWKVYILDEVHLLSKAAMGRILKSLEEPPAGVVFMLCTTDPEDLLDTIKNRCQVKLPITKPPTRELMDFMQKICLSEDKNYDLAGLRMLSTLSDNVVRDSLNNLERVLATRGSASAEHVSEEFKQVSDNILFEFYNAYRDDDYVSYLNVLYKIKMSFNFNQFITTLSAFTTRGIYILNSVDVEGLSVEELQLYKNLFKAFTPKELSSILSKIRTLTNGDIEANLMAFIYCKDSLSVEGNVLSAEAINTSATTLDDERHVRNSNLKVLETAKLQEGTKSLGSELEEVKLSAELGDLFTFEKVKS